MIIAPLPRSKVMWFGNLVCLFKHTHTTTEINHHVQQKFQYCRKKKTITDCTKKSLTSTCFLENFISKKGEVFLENGISYYL